MKITDALTFDDICLLPKYSNIESRSLVSTKTSLGRLSLDAPIISSPMKTVTGYEMAQNLGELGCLGYIHRFHSSDEKEGIKLQAAEIKKCTVPVGFAIGVGDTWRDRLEACLEAGGSSVMIDIAHGNHIKQFRVLEQLRKLYPDLHVVAANIAEPSALNTLEDFGVDAVRVGVGGGSVCSTRIMTGFGVPSVTSLLSCSLHKKAKNLKISLIQDGGIRYPADVVKSIAVGADAVIIGGLFAGTVESSGEVIYDSYTNQYSKKYMGSASASAKGNQKFVEGAEKTVQLKGPVRNLIENMLDGLRSGLSYGGCTNIQDFKLNVELLRITSNGLKESHPHLLF